MARLPHEDFHAGTLAALDVVFLHDNPVIASEIVAATDSKGLLRHAIREEYYNLEKLKQAIRDSKPRRRRRTRSDRESRPKHG